MEVEENDCGTRVCVCVCVRKKVKNLLMSYL